ncbi:MAG: hypothetical protein UR23_C0045G0005 [Candidatus Roizmanbacteria bacterium GW2011_GWA2_32_13]|uniref:Uncharacterized protein n=1 Tax=Candidatus Roizmanbacteria bacterium GW2011_GWA2_32_13 TaxID=1618475 RepID=A0A0F9YPM5_9BACT|nr:MAG: hypothetical protein UR23_C0045G0005 [Candidatus Roizmanbacteria bacterium GW2011_GWA2_32_13]
MIGFTFIIATFVGIFISGGITLRHFFLKKMRSKRLKNKKYIYNNAIKSKSKKLKKLLKIT